jgi:S1-C subfamily serine protease
MIEKLSSPDVQKKKAPVLAPAGLLGIRVGKEATDEEAGVTVKDVLADSPAAAAGFKTGDRLLTLDGRWTDTVTDCYLAATLLQPGAPVTARVLRDGKKMTLKLTVRAGL